MTQINDLINRIGKTLKHQLKWARRHNLEAWRIYDRDIPQYPFAIDIYGNHVHLQEYDTGWIMQHAEYEAWLAEHGINRYAGGWGSGNFRVQPNYLVAEIDLT